MSKGGYTGGERELSPEEREELNRRYKKSSGGGCFGVFILVFAVPILVGVLLGVLL